MTPTETTKLCTLSDLILRDEDRRTDVVELAKLGRVAGKLIPEMRAELDDAMQDATRWREATAAGAESDEALAKLAHDECHPHYPYRWGDVDGPGLSESADFVHVARVVRERVQAQCAAQLAEALDVHDVSWPEMLKMVEQEARAADQRVGMNGAEPPLLRRLDPEGAYDTEADFVSDFNEQREALANLMKYANLLDAPVIFDASALYRELGSKRAAAANATREPRPGEVWRCDLYPGREVVATAQMYKPLSLERTPGCLFDNLDGSPSGLWMANIEAWHFVRGPEAAEPATPAPTAALTIPPRTLEWARSKDESYSNAECALAAFILANASGAVGGSNG